MLLQVSVQHTGDSQADLSMAGSGDIQSNHLSAYQLRRNLSVWQLPIFFGGQPFFSKRHAPLAVVSRKVATLSILLALLGDQPLDEVDRFVGRVDLAVQLGRSRGGQPAAVAGAGGQTELAQ
jgi:hypothetical protein